MNYREDITYIVDLLYITPERDYTGDEINKSTYILKKYNIGDIWLGLSPTQAGLNKEEYIEYLIKSSDVIQNVIQREIKINHILE